MAFNRDGNGRSGGGGGFRSRPSFSAKGGPASGWGDRSGGRPSFGDRDRGPVEMHQAVCDNCGKNCEVPFRPTQGKPIFCSNCFRSQKEGSDSSSRYESRSSSRSEDRQMFDATCADCGDSCKVPFQPTGDKPVFCSNCFGGKKNAGGSTGGGKNEFEQLNVKLDKILSILSSAVDEVEEIAVEKVEKPAKVKKTARPSKESKVKEVKPEETVPVTP